MTGLTIGEIRLWRSALLGDAGQSMTRILATIDGASEDLAKKGVPASWTGDVSTAARIGRDDLVNDLEEFQGILTVLRRAFFDAEAGARGVERALARTQDRAAALDFAISDDGSVHDVASSAGFDTVAAAEAHRRARVRLMDTVLHDLDDVRRQADAVDDALTSALTSAFARVGEEGATGTYGQVSPEVRVRWAGMTDAQRRAALQQMANELAARYGLPATSISFEDLPDDIGNYLGYWSESEGKLVIDIDDVADPVNAINTVAHEMRHAGQHEMARDADPGIFTDALVWLGVIADPFDHPGVTEEQARAWADNFAHYVRPEDNFQGYLDQPVESDARASGKEFVDGLTPEQLTEYVRRATAAAPPPTSAPTPTSAPPPTSAPTPTSAPPPTSAPTPWPTSTPSPTGS
jgi:hypothetical protein